MGVEYGSMEQVAMEMLDRVGGNSALLPSTLHTRGAVAVAAGYVDTIGGGVSERVDALDPFKASVALTGIATSVMSPRRRDPVKDEAIRFTRHYLDRTANEKHVNPEIHEYGAGIMADSHTVDPFLNGMLGLKVSGRPSKLATVLKRFGVMDGTVRPFAALKFLKRTEVEATLAAAAWKIVTLRRDRTSYEDHRASQAIAHIRSFHGPVLQMMGLDSFYVEALAAATSLELKNEGKQKDLITAASMLEGLDDEVIEGVHSKLLKGLGLDEVSTLTGDNVVGYNGMYEAQSDYGLEAKTRIKSVESLARKIDGGSGEGIMDLIGVTLIGEDDEGVLGLLKTMIDNIGDSEVFELAASAGKDHAFSVCGPKEYVDKFSSPMEEAGLDVSARIKGEGFKIVKLTGIYRHNGSNVPIEVQITKRADYDESRYGSSAHFLMKNGMVLPRSMEKVAVKSMSEIRDRAQNFGHLGLNPHPDAVDRRQRFMARVNS